MKILVLLGVCIFLLILALSPRHRDIKHDWSLLFSGESPMRARWFGSIVLLQVGMSLLLMVFVLAIADVIIWLI